MSFLDKPTFGGRVVNIVLVVVFAAIFFYVLYGVIRAATRDGIIAARQRLKEDARPNGGEGT
jgi:hypothetical protein